ncbi:enoyl-CoA hydratase/isomerase family protein [Wenzhouxiangella marina]|uniref:Enoyl-CoA hydratase n=1 Tax=Wenzhouxiangella marina TaxID=1579979 RepID=A0A0K0XXF7_9GAMM|nr:enoyl-CoA hydratase/isomerase family protein [Wenzhouxiangella marina]AKS42368.1 enoyl-CoA hydratase [Wenzhouxiangella marina]MBB6085859.1 enoyl-CoA hydratase/carnithine racemase [Wenzhouxiangella marina]
MIERISHVDGIVELRLNRPPVNALNPGLVSELSQALASVEAGGAKGIVLSGSPGLFSAGLDVPGLLRLDERSMRAFWREFFGLLEQLARSPAMICAALTGHSPAGGTVLALFCDYRVLAKGDYRLGLNEVQVGLVVPPVIHQALVRLIGRYPAERHLVAGQMIPAEDALAIGLVDELVPLGEVVDQSVRWLQSHLDMPAHALKATRQLCRADLGALFDDPGALDIDAFVEGWFAEETQATLERLVERLGKKS